jgi:hypothetical protein
MDSTNEPAFRATAASTVLNADDDCAVLAIHGQVVFHMSIAQAREFSMALAKAANDAELKLKD